MDNKIFLDLLQSIDNQSKQQDKLVETLLSYNEKSTQVYTILEKFENNENNLKEIIKATNDKLIKSNDNLKSDFGLHKYWCFVTAKII